MGPPLAFEILIERRGKRFRAVLVGSTAEARFSLPDLQVLERFQSQCSTRSRSSRHLHIDQDSSENHAKEIGSQLFRAVFSGEVARRFERERREAKAHDSKVRLRLRLTVPVLDVLPWEYLYDPQEEQFLSLSGDVSIVRAIEVGGSRRPPVIGPLHMLLVGVCPPGLDPLDLKQEQGKIEAALSKYTRHRLVVIERLGAGTLRALADRLSRGDIHILHFLGHGAFEREGGGVLYLEDALGESMPADRELLDTLLHHESLRLVVLNSCEGACLSPDAPFSGVAQTLLRRGVPAVLAMQCPVEDQFAIALADNFYRALARTRRIAGALAETRRDLLADGFREEWGAPVLYLHASDGELLPALHISPWEAMLDRGREINPATWLKLAAVLVGLVVAAVVFHGVSMALDPCPSPRGLDLKFAYIPPGSFQMGAEGHGDGPPHQVTLSKPFCLSVGEMTQKGWVDVEGSNPSATKGDELPVENVSWDDVERFLEKLNRREPLGKLSLLTEAQWEYAASGGSEGPASSDEKYANCASDQVLPVGSLPATRWGLHDMSGNVYEWVQDVSPYGREPVTDPVGGSRPDNQRVRRGGSFDSKPLDCLVTTRTFTAQTYKKYDTGFRIAREPVRRSFLQVISFLLHRLLP